MKLLKTTLILLISFLFTSCINKTTTIAKNIGVENQLSKDTKENEITFKGKTYKIGDEIPDELIRGYVFDSYKEGNKFTYNTYFNEIDLINGVESKNSLDFSDKNVISISSIKNNKIDLDLNFIRKYYDSNSKKYSTLSTNLDFTNKNIDPILNLIFLLDFNNKKYSPKLSLLSFYYDDKSNIETDFDFNSKINSAILTNYKFIETTKKLVLINNKFESVNLKIFSFDANVNGDNINGKIYLSNKIGIQNIEFNFKDASTKKTYNVQFLFDNFLVTRNLENQYYEEKKDNCIKNSEIAISNYENNLEKLPSDVYFFDLTYLDKLPCEFSALISGKKSLYLIINNYVPEEVFKINTLKSINISTFSYEIKLPKITTNTSLEDLSISTYGSVTLSKEILNIKELKKLSIKSKSKLDLDGIDKLTELESIIINSGFPVNLKGLESLKKLTHLELYNNNFEKIPEFVTNNNYLNYLDLSHNKINNIPQEISNLTNLETIVLDGNNITDFTNLLMLPSIKDIYLRNNSITDLPIETIMKIERPITISLDVNKIPKEQLEKVKKNKYIQIY